MILHKFFIYIRNIVNYLLLILLSIQGAYQLFNWARLKKTWKVYHTWNKLGIRPPLG